MSTAVGFHRLSFPKRRGRRDSVYGWIGRLKTKVGMDKHGPTACCRHEVTSVTKQCATDAHFNVRGLDENMLKLNLGLPEP